MTVGYATAGITATQPADFTSMTGTVSFAPGRVSATVAVPVRGDTADEADEQFRVRLSSPTHATLADAVGAGTIVDDDSPTPSALRLTIGDVTISEGNGGTRTATLTASLSGPSTSTVTVSYVTANVEATRPADYVPKAETIAFEPGVINRPINVSVKADTAVEAAERFKVVLSSPSGGATISDGTGLVTIRDDD